MPLTNRSKRIEYVSRLNTNMTKTKKLLHQLRLVSDANAPPIAARLLRILAKDITDTEMRKHYEYTAASIEDLPLCWDKVLTAISTANIDPGLNSTCEPCSPVTTKLSYEGQEFFNSLAELCHQRLKRLRSISLTVSPKAMWYVPKLTHLDKDNIGTEVQRWLNALGLTEAPEFCLPSRMSSGQILDTVSAMRETIIKRNLAAAYSDENTMAVLDELEALYGVLLHYFNKSISKTFTANLSLCAMPGFVYCDKCWRMIPESYASRFMSRCDLHNYQTGKSTDSRKAKIVHDIFSKENPVFPPAVAEQLAQLNAAWKPDYGGLSAEAWLHVLENDLTVRHVVEKLPQVFYNLPSVWECCPHSYQYIMDNGGDPQSIASVLSVLAPRLNDENSKEQEARSSMHLFLERNFWFYRQDLALAEVWLQMYASQYTGRKHGGVRKNSGGKRPGAGRPHKTT